MFVRVVLKEFSPLWNEELGNLVMESVRSAKGVLRVEGYVTLVYVDFDGAAV